MTLYELTDAMAQLEDMDDIDPQTLADTLEGLQMELDEKLLNIGRWVRNLEAEATGIKSEEERLYKKRKAMENRAASLKEFVRQAMIAVDKRKVSDGVITWGIQNNPARVELKPDAEIPHEWCTHNPETWVPDKNLIGQALKGGNALPFAELVQEQGVRLR